MLPPLAQVALEEGETVARNLEAELEGRPLAAFTFHDKGFVVSDGTRRGVADIAGKSSGERMAHLLKDAIEWEYRQSVTHLRGWDPLALRPLLVLRLRRTTSPRLYSLPSAAEAGAIAGFRLPSAMFKVSEAVALEAATWRNFWHGLSLGDPRWARYKTSRWPVMGFHDHRLYTKICLRWNGWSLGAVRRRPRRPARSGPPAGPWCIRQRCVPAGGRPRLPLRRRHPVDADVVGVAVAVAAVPLDFSQWQRLIPPGPEQQQPPVEPAPGSGPGCARISPRPSLSQRPAWRWRHAHARHGRPLRGGRASPAGVVSRV